MIITTYDFGGHRRWTIKNHLRQYAAFRGYPGADLLYTHLPTGKYVIILSQYNIGIFLSCAVL